MRPPPDDYLQTMAEIELPHPKSIDHAVPGDRRCGVRPDHLREQMHADCQRTTDSPQG